MELGDKMDLSSYLLKPVQRMSKYALLLADLIKEVGSAQEAELAVLLTATNMVKFQLRHGNDLLAMDAVRDCDVSLRSFSLPPTRGRCHLVTQTDGVGVLLPNSLHPLPQVNLKEQGQLIRQDEFTVWTGRRKCERHVFLFEELVLFSKPKRMEGGLDVFIYKHSFKVTQPAPRWRSVSQLVGRKPEVGHRAVLRPHQLRTTAPELPWHPSHLIRHWIVGILTPRPLIVPADGRRGSDGVQRRQRAVL